MNPCQNCGKLNTPETNFCRFCGTKFTIRPQIQQQHHPQPQSQSDNPYGFTAPRPYAWKTDEFQTNTEARKTQSIENSAAPNPFDQANQNYSPATLAYSPGQHISRPFSCPSCTSHFLPRVERRISTAGWITFAILLVFFFPLFWIGLLIKEDVHICQTCNLKLQ